VLDHQRGDRQQRAQHGYADGYGDAMPADELARAVSDARRPGRDRPAGQVLAKIRREIGGRGVAIPAFTRKRLEADPVELVLEQPGELARIGETALHSVPGARCRREHAAAGPGRVVGDVRGGLGRRARQQFVQHRAKRPHVGPGVDVFRTDGGLLWTHVVRGANDHASPRVFRPGLVLGGEHLGDAEVDDPGRRRAIDVGHEDIGRLEVAVNDALEVGVLDRSADFADEREPRPQADAILAAVARDGQPGDVVHHEVRAAVVTAAGVENACDAGMAHQRQHLPLCFEPRREPGTREPGLEQLDGDDATDRLFLRGKEDLAHAALAQRLEHPVLTDCGRRRNRGMRPVHGRPERQATVGRSVMGTQQALDPRRDCRIRIGQTGSAPLTRELQAIEEQLLLVGRCLAHAEPVPAQPAVSTLEIVYPFSPDGCCPAERTVPRRTVRHSCGMSLMAPALRM
jgi:hypothetical protein